eukprot:32915-Ditylum_brightwellii.AAC.1
MQVKGEGHIRWRVHGNYGRIWTIETGAYYVPAAHICLFSPQICFVVVSFWVGTSNMLLPLR